MNLNIDQILEHVSPWDFSVTIGGVPYSTRRPSIGELGAMSGGGKDIGQLAALVNSLFVTPPAVRWELPTLMAFLGGYLEYFARHTDQKKEGTATMEQMAKAEVSRLFGNSSPPSSGPVSPATGQPPL